MITQQENIKKIKTEIDMLLASGQKDIYILIDGDRTLIPVDSAKYFFQTLHLELNDIKRIFKQFGYSFSAFYKVALYYSKIDEFQYKIACLESAKRVNIYPEFISFINAIKHKSKLIVVTSGIKQIWKNILKNNELEFIHLIAGSYFPDDKFVVDKQAKGIIANTLKVANKKVFAFGDAIIDYEMLKEVDNSYLVVNEKENKSFIPFAKKINNLKQISFSDFFHSGIPVTNLTKVANQILTI